MNVYLKSRHKKYHITQDKYQYILTQVLKRKDGDNAGEEYEDVLGYYSNVDSLMKRLISLHCLKQQERTSVLESIDKVCKDVKKLLIEKAE